MQVGDMIRVKRTEQLAEVVSVEEHHCWVRLFDGDECTFLLDEVEVINASR